MVKGYCFKCKKDVEVNAPSYSLNKIGRAMVRGTCSQCGGKVAKLLGKADTPADLAAKMAKRGGAHKKSRKGSKKSHKKKSRK